MKKTLTFIILLEKNGFAISIFELKNLCRYLKSEHKINEDERITRV